MAFLIPSREARPGDDPIFALNTEARKRAAAGEKIINATVGSLLADDGSLATLPTVVETIHATPANVAAGYAPISGSADFLAGVVNDLFGGTKAADWATAVATPGGTGALRHAIANFLEPGQSLLTTSFFWGPYKTLADESDRKLATFTTFDAKGGLDLASFESKLDELLSKQARALVLLNSPCHNPTGYSFTDEESKRLAGILRNASTRGPITVCLDVAYARFGARDGLRAMIDEMVGLAPDILPLVAWSASKTFLQYGLRIGALAAVHPDPEQRRRIDASLTYSCRGTWSNVNAGGMTAIAKILKDPALGAKVDRERDGFVELLAKRVATWNTFARPKGLLYPRYDGGFFTTVFTPNAFDVAARLKDQGIFVVPQEGAIRIALCSVAEADIERLVDGIASTLG